MSMFFGSIASTQSLRSVADSVAESYSTAPDFNVNLNELDKNDIIKYMEIYEVPTIEDDDLDFWANLGIFILNIFGSGYDYPNHWFFIVYTKKGNILLCEKGEKTVTIQKYDSKDKIIQDEKDNYHGNKPKFQRKVIVKDGITIKKLIEVADKATGHYDLINDNCQDFVRFICRNFEK